ncbi:MAG: histidine phosphatase family protein [Candidatus Acidiferrales bacterium]
MGTIYLIRHGETDWNREKRLQGITDVPLNRAGIAQGRRLAGWLKRVGAGCIFTSPLRRARHTAMTLHRAGGWPVIVCDELREIDHGVWTGMALGEIGRRFPPGLACWRTNPEKLRVENAEPLQRAYSRASRFLLQVIGMVSRGDVVVVSHGVIIALMVCAAMGSSSARVWDFPQPNACIQAVRIHRRQIGAWETLDHGPFG